MPHVSDAINRLAAELLNTAHQHGSDRGLSHDEIGLALGLATYGYGREVEGIVRRGEAIDEDGKPIEPE